MVEFQELTDRYPELDRFFDADSERRQLQKRLTNRLLAYFDAIYEALFVNHPSSQLPIVVWMTQDQKNPDNPFQGPVPLLVRLPQEFVQYDYREGNDARGGVVRKNALSDLNPAIEEVLKLPKEELQGIIKGIDSRMEEIGDKQKRQLIVGRLEEWERETGYERDFIVKETQRHDYTLALKDLHGHYTRALGQSPQSR
jgi:hypothetical protein